MCDEIHLKDGTEITMFPEAWDATEYAKPDNQRTKPTFTMSCLCVYPIDHIEAWLKATFPNKKFERDPICGVWQEL